MRLTAVVCLVLLLLSVVAFCLFGFLASLEPTATPNRFLFFRIGYAATGVACLVGVGFLLMSSLRR